MKSGMTIRVGVALVALLAAMQTHSQGSTPEVPGNAILLPSPQTEPALAQVVREIADPHFGTRWVLMRDSSHPGGPGRLEPFAEMEGKVSRREPVSAPHQPLPAIRAGDHLIVQEDTPVAQVRLEAVALGPAVVGSPLKVRLKIGGVVAWAVAMAPGHAAFKLEAEMRP